MPPGKLTAQACHAARLSLLRYIEHHPAAAPDILNKNSAGSIVVLAAPDLSHLQQATTFATHHGLPWALFVDSGHVLPPSFDGSPIPTALAIGPVLREQVRPITRAYPCI